MRWIVVVFALWAFPAAAQTVEVTAGEHGDFTRLVFSLPSPGEWSVSRTEEGYLLEFPAAERFDLTRAFDRIDRRRLKAITPSDGALNLTVACACHAFPFEFRPDILVVDLRDGPPPSGSSFELSEDGRVLLPLGTPSAQPAVAQPDLSYDWRKEWVSVRRQDKMDRSKIEAMPARNLSGLRDALLAQFARAASQGLVDPTVPNRREEGQQQGHNDYVTPNFRIGEPLTSRPATDASPSLATDGGTCPDEKSLAIEEWGSDRLPALQLSDAMTHLVGEFDRPNAEAVLEKVRSYLHLGFGAEAELLLRTLPPSNSESDLLRDVARVMDAPSQSGGALLTMASCESPVALWSVLAAGKVAPEANLGAVLQAMSRLPPHLRRHLGPRLAAILLDSGDPDRAMIVLQTLTRLPGPPDGATSVTAARIAIARGEGKDASTLLDEVLKQSGPIEPLALVTLIDLHAADAVPIDAGLADQLAAHLVEATDTPDAPTLQRSLVLARALSDDFVAAFDELRAAPSAEQALWKILAEGPDSAVISHSIGADPEGADADTRRLLSKRLFNLGFRSEAKRWHPVIPDVSEVGDSPLHRAIVSRDWANLPDDTGTAWKAASLQLGSSDFNLAEPLAESQRIVATSIETRRAITELLSTIGRPEP